MITPNYRALDAEGLWQTAARLHRFNYSSSINRIFFRLMRARIQFLSEENRALLINDRRACIKPRNAKHIKRKVV